MLSDDLILNEEKDKVAAHILEFFSAVTICANEEVVLNMYFVQE